LSNRTFPAGFAAALCAWAPALAAGSAPPAAEIKINEIQVIGTHNSYHAGIAPSEAKLFARSNPQVYDSLDYRHRPLAEQFAAGVRQIELDIFADGDGGLYVHPKGPDAVAAAKLPKDPDFDPEGLMKRPGFKVMHLQDFDYRSTCQTLIACLQTVRGWSRANPGHVPLFILLETKQSDLPPQYHASTPERFTAATFDALDAEIRSVFPPDGMIIPDQVRGKRATLEEAVLRHEWPALSAARGKVIFLLDQRSDGPLYLQGHPSLRNRVIFTNAAPGQPDCAFTEENDGSQETIAGLVRKGYLVRTRTDADTKQGRNNDTRRREIALASGAQLLSTDYPASEPSQWSGYSVSLPGDAVARCNPVAAPPSCNIVILEPDTMVTK
jgi:Phosphoinositide phospholipase C, Ca2+-dependent